MDSAKLFCNFSIVLNHSRHDFCSSAIGIAIDPRQIFIKYSFASTFWQAAWCPYCRDQKVIHCNRALTLPLMVNRGAIHDFGQSLTQFCEPGVYFLAKS